MRCLLLAVFSVALSLWTPACGGDDTSPADAAVPDAAVPDAAPPDAPVQDLCALLCDCTVATCSQEMTACLEQCATLTASARACRIEHCGYAMNDPGFHCPHALGEDLCD